MRRFVMDDKLNSITNLRLKDSSSYGYTKDFILGYHIDLVNAKIGRLRKSNTAWRCI